jgi:hypothetical protein
MTLSVVDDPLGIKAYVHNFYVGKDILVDFSGGQVIPHITKHVTQKVHEAH